MNRYAGLQRYDIPVIQFLLPFSVGTFSSAEVDTWLDERIAWYGDMHDDRKFVEHIYINCRRALQAKPFNVRHVPSLDKFRALSALRPFFGQRCTLILFPQQDMRLFIFQLHSFT